MNERKVKIASEGMILTNGTDFGRKIYLADGTDETSWYEIPEEKYEETMKKTDD